VKPRFTPGTVLRVRDKKGVNYFITVLGIESSHTWDTRCHVIEFPGLVIRTDPLNKGIWISKQLPYGHIQVEILKELVP
jgi:hypothetical protein